MGGNDKKQKTDSVEEKPSVECECSVCEKRKDVSEQKDLEDGWPECHGRMMMVIAE